MRHLLTLVTCVALLGVAAFVEGAPKYPAGTGGVGTQGTVASVGSRGFTMTVKDKTISVMCTSMTKFMEDGKPIPANSIKEGIDVSVEGGVSGQDQMMANTVSIVHPHKRKK